LEEEALHMAIEATEEFNSARVAALLSPKVSPARPPARRLGEMIDRL
jgi:hypothetical protein